MQKIIAYVILALLALSSCSPAANPIIIPSNMTTTTEPTIDDSHPYFPTQSILVHSKMTALLTRGTLVLDNGYLRLEFPFSDDSVLPIWPYGFSLKMEDGTVKILDEEKKEVARLGDTLRMGGGEGDARFAGLTLPVGAKWPFWIVGDLVGSVPPVIFSQQGVSGELRSGWQKKTVTELETLLGKPLPLPGYLPAGYEVREIYYSGKTASPIYFADILALISDQPVVWEGNLYTSNIAYLISWNDVPIYPSANMGEVIPVANGGKGLLQQGDEGFVLWWPGYGPNDPLGSTLKFYANSQFPKDELIKIASSVPPNP